MADKVRNYYIYTAPRRIEGDENDLISGLSVSLRMQVCGEVWAGVGRCEVVCQRDDPTWVVSGLQGAIVSKRRHLWTGLTENAASKCEAHCSAHPCFPSCGGLRRGQVAVGRGDACLFYLLTCPSTYFSLAPP